MAFLFAASWRAAAAGGGAAPDLQFDGERAMAHLRDQCAFGPRVPGTPAHDRCRAYFMDHWKALGIPAREQRFPARPSLLGGRPVMMTNVLAVLGDPAAPAVIVSAHWDSRPIAEKDNDALQAREPIVGANDGASGAAAVLELGRVFQDRPTSCTLIFALLDGEDLGGTRAPDEWCLGSKYLADRLKPQWDARLNINLDLVGDRDQEFTYELYGQIIAPEFFEFCWSAGRELYPEAFRGMDRRRVLDDHISFLRRGIPAFNLIDMDYAHWHTQSDTPDKCSATSLETAGRTVEAILRRLDERVWDFAAGLLPDELSGF